MKVLFIEPPFERFIGFRCEWFPMGLVSMATYLKKRGHYSRVYNAEHDNSLPYLGIENYAANFHRYSEALKKSSHHVWKEVQAMLNEYQPNVVGLSIKTAKVPSAFRIAEMAKKILPGVKVIAGGPHATVCPEEALAFPFIDCVVRREGEETILEVVQRIEEGRDLLDIPGISYKRNGKVFHNGNRPLIRQLGSLPYPDRKLLIGYGDYTPTQLGWIMTSRGCPYNCSYCCSKSIWTRKVRYRPKESVLGEVEELRREHKVADLNFMDDSFTVNRQYVFDLCTAFLERKLKMTWSCLTRADLLDEEMVKVMKSAGCTKVDVGIESGSKRVQKIINKGVILEEIPKMARTLRKNSLFWAGFFMMGFPGETKEDVLYTLDFMKKIKPNWVCFSIFTPYPGTALYEKAKELGLIPEKFDYSLYAHQSPVNCFSEKISAEEFRELTGLMLREVRRHNSSIYALFRRAITKDYFRNPRLFVLDIKKLLTWILPIKR